jgi:Domain of unknown function (DUF5655)
MTTTGATKPKSLWACPKCRQTFVTPNVWHSCVNVPVDTHFQDKPPVLRATFDKFVKLAENNGPVTLRRVKTRIALQANTCFAAVTVRKADLHCHVVLDHGQMRAPVRKVDKLNNNYVHVFLLATPANADARVASLLKEAYAVDRERHGALST